MTLAGIPDPGPGSSSFDLLDEKVRRWIWKQGWGSLRDIQERSIPLLLSADRDLIISAATASGKTEAAFLPIVSWIASHGRREGAGFDAIYVSPLKALINDQFGRIEGLCEELGIPVTKWHGDVGAGVKARARSRPSGILLITPESLEAILIRRGPEAPRLFRLLAFAVVDEMHAFMDGPRGKQLQSIMHRVETASGHRITRVGLSATLADEIAPRHFLRPGDPGAVTILASKGSQDIRLQVRGYVEPERDLARKPPAAAGDHEAADPGNTAETAIVRHLFDSLRGKRGLVFAGSRRRVETTAVGLSELTQAVGVPEEFFAHHGNLSREHREEAERRMKDPARPATIVCTTTLELGIDIGAIDSVAQLGPGHTVSGMRQRLGRSGRREGQAATMRVYVKEEPLSQATHPLDALRRGTVQAVAMLELMLERWNEPPEPGRLHLSTLVHQLLALVVQHAGITVSQGWQSLCASGVFDAVDKDLYLSVLRRMGHPDVALIEQAPDGTLLPGKAGEGVIQGRDFYAVFMGGQEYRVVEVGGRNIGTVPESQLYITGQLLMLAGRRWRIQEVDGSRKEITVVKAFGGQPPIFGGDPVPPSEGVIRAMRRTYETIAVPTFLDHVAIGLLKEARESFDYLGLRNGSVCRHGDSLLIFPWVGARRQMALFLALTRAQLEPVQLGLAISVPEVAGAKLRNELAALAHAPAPNPLDLASMVEEKAFEKYDPFLDDDLLCRAYASERIDASRLPALAGDILSRWPPASSARPGALPSTCIAPDPSQHLIS